MKKEMIPFLCIMIILVVSGCTSEGGAGGIQTGSMVLEFEKGYSFDDMQYHTDYYTMCDHVHDVWEWDNVPDITASQSISTEDPYEPCTGLAGLHCEEVGFGAFAKFHENLMPLTDADLQSATIPSTIQGNLLGFCAQIGQVYYLNTYQGQDVLFEVTDITDVGIEINYRVL